MSLFLPNMYQKSVYDINYEKIKEKGIKVLLFDMDNTCLGYHEEEVSLELVSLMKRLRNMGFLIYLFSNSIKGDKVKKIASSLEVGFYACSMKPFSRNFLRVIRDTGVSSLEIAMIGDQLFTDILGGNRMSIFTVLVVPIDKNELIFTRFLRRLERVVFDKLKNKGLFDKGVYYD